MTTETVWESKEAASGLRVRAELGNTGLVLTLRRRALMIGKDGPLTAARLIHSQLMVWWPSPIDEAMRLVAHWLDFYDPSLREGLQPLAEKLASIPDAPSTGSVPPRGGGLLS